MSTCNHMHKKSGQNLNACIMYLRHRGRMRVGEMVSCIGI